MGSLVEKRGALQQDQTAPTTHLGFAPTLALDTSKALPNSPSTESPHQDSDQTTWPTGA